MAPLSSSSKISMHPDFLLLSFSLFFLFRHSAGVNMGYVGITYDAHTPYTYEGGGISAAEIGFKAVRLLDVDAGSISEFASVNDQIRIDLNVKSSLIIPLATNKTFAASWIKDNVLSNFTYGPISVGYDAIPGPNADLVIPAMKNLRDAWLKHPGLPAVQFSTPLSFGLIKSPKPPSKAEFDETVAERYLVPLLDFLSSTNSSFMIDVFPSQMVADYGESLSFAVFEGRVAEYVTDHVTGCVYTNLFDLMQDAVLVALKKLGYEDVPVVSTTGWQGKTHSVDQRQGENDLRAGEYLGRVVTHVASGKGTPLRPGRAMEVYYHSLFDLPGKKGRSQRLTWGVMWPVGYIKYEVPMGPDSIKPNQYLYKHAALAASLSTLALATVFFRK